ncbi:AAA family ATPase [Microbacterium trichothecenolyticum]|nr:AAA family ATPase [Microbacterium trichothecenolyticum]
MRGGLERWKRGRDSRGVRQAIAYAVEGVCDAHVQEKTGVDALEAYSAAARDSTVRRFIVEGGTVRSDDLSPGALRVWLTGHDPATGEERGKSQLRAEADLLLDGTLNHAKSYSIAALLHPGLAAEFEALQDRIRDRTILLWQRELNARRGHGGLIRESISRLEVVELRHRRSRALDPHIHRHLWLNVKVQGEDGKWSNVDSRVAMKFHTVINAEGELAARSDPQWIAALARHGLTIGADGEIAELAAAVAPLSRRSAQIEANRARLVAEWQTAHDGLRPSVDVLAQIDRRAWAVSRPNKPALIDEESWEHAVRDELATLDPQLLDERAPHPLATAAIGELDLDLLAAKAIVDADERSRASSGRFSRFDLRAGALRALAGSGVVADRDSLDEVVAQIIGRANQRAIRLVAEPAAPDHIKQFMSTETCRLKVRLAGRFDALATPGRSRLPEELRRDAASIDAIDQLDKSQLVAACAIAGTDRLVTVTGPAGAGKTTMLRVAHAALYAQRRHLLVVAPTRKAASVAAREVGSDACSLHALLHDHGYRWQPDAAGAQVWTRLSVGDCDPLTRAEYRGPQRYPLYPRDRLVVDEAGMVDLQTADALTELALDIGVDLALVGDPHQAVPVGHAGAMAIAARHAPATVELDTVHRFHDRGYANLTLQLRDPRDHQHALQISTALAVGGHVHRVDSTEAARTVMVDEYVTGHARGQRTALVCGSNAEADAVNTLIQQHRVDTGELDPTVLAWGREEQRLLVGDTVQTRRNDPRSGVDNRATWIIDRIRKEGIDLVSPTDSGERRRITHDYAVAHVQLAYASTVHGIQGDTTNTAIVGPDVDAAGLYVGLTRGRHHNRALVIAPTDATAIEHLADTMLRGATEITITQSMRAAEAELRRAAHDRAALPIGYGMAGLPGPSIQR